jgi:DNA polymerase III delta prime subunit
MIVGHQRQIKLLDLHISSDTTSHAYLFTGPRHVGKMTIARSVVAAILCHKRSRGLLASCGTCSICVSFASGAHPDVFIQDTEESGETSLRLEAVHRIRDRASRSSYGGTHIFLIRDIARMTREAIHALLKVLEEPRSNILFFLLAESIADVPDTIRSRAWHMSFWPISTETIASFLEQEKKISRKKALAAAYLAGGLPGIGVNAIKEPANILQNNVMERERALLVLFDSITDRLAYADTLRDHSDRMQTWYTESIAILTHVLHNSIAKTPQASHDVYVIASICRRLLQGKARFIKPYAAKRILFESDMLHNYSLHSMIYKKYASFHAVVN